MKLCWFGIYRPDFGRNKVYISGLRELGVKVMECRDDSSGLDKYWRLWRKHQAFATSGGYDALVVGYPGHIVVPLAKMISKKPVVFDALCTLYEGEVISRGNYKLRPLKRAWIRLIDRMAARRADLILIESNAQKQFFIKRFSLDPNKIVRIFSGADEGVFHPDLSVKKHDRFTVVFRGKFLPEAGVKYIIQAAKALENSGIDFLVIGSGHTEKEVSTLIGSLKPSNLEWVNEYLPDDLLRTKMLECHVALGQFAKHERLERTIPHKAFEALALGLPYVTGRAAGISELLTDGKDCLMVNLADPADLAAKILMLKNDPELSKNIAEAGHRLFEDKLTAKKLAQTIIFAIANIGN